MSNAFIIFNKSGAIYVIPNFDSERTGMQILDEFAKQHKDVIRKELNFLLVPQTEYPFK